MDEELREKCTRAVELDHPLDDVALDKLLDIPLEEPREALEESHYIGHLGEQSVYEGTRYELLRDFLRLTRPKEQDVVYDLGAGYGRMLLLGGITTSATYKGIEIVPERVKLLQKNIERLKLKNVFCQNDNAANADFSDGNIFFFYNPFSRPTLEHVGDRLRKLAKERPITIVSVGMCSDYFDEQEWLKGTLHAIKWSLQIYKSK